MSKRKWQDDVSGLHQELKDLFAGRGPEFLWDTSIRLKLRWPSLQSAPAIGHEYFYIGRASAKALYEAVSRLPRGVMMQILGAKGSGKSTVMATISAFLLGNGKPVVYISGHDFIVSPVSVLHRALWLCYSGDEEKPEMAELLGVVNLPDVAEWCTSRSLLLVVDDWDKVEKQEECCNALMSARFGNMMVRISSINSRERYEWETSDKASDYVQTEEFDGPFTQLELQTWLSHAELSRTRLKKLDYFTGCMPPLMQYYAECKDDDLFMKRISRPVTNKMQIELGEKLKDKESVEAALELVTSHDGLLIPDLLEGMKLSCFYKVGGYCYRVLCPYLRTVAEKMILDEGSKVEKRLLMDDIQVWIAAIQTDLEADVSARNPARIGWNVEGLVIGAIRVQGQVLTGLPFAFYKTYAHNKELDVLRSLKSDILGHGVLLGPLAFNEKAVDIVYIILKEGVLHITALQISVAQWKTREGKKSHETWRKEVLPKWKPAGVSVQSKFFYLMPEAVRLEDISDVEVRKFSEICPQLCFLDALKLEEPLPVEESAKRKCAGTRKDGGNCGNTSTCPGCKVEGYCQCKWFCYRHVGLN